MCDVTGRNLQFLAVISRWNEDVSWVAQLPIPAVVYEHAKPQAVYNVPLNKGSEASAYLQFILDHFSCLPAWTLFLHAHGQTKRGFGSDSRGGGVWARHAATDPAEVAALLDVERIGRPFLAIGHVSREDWALPGGLHAAAKAFSRAAPPGSHHAAWEPVQKGKAGCYRSCDAMAQLVERAQYRGCRKPYSWSVGAEFWAARRRVLARPRSYWEAAMALALGGRDIARYGHSRGDVATAVGYCFESIWHHILGEPLYGFKPAFTYIEQLPLRSPP